MDDVVVIGAGIAGLAAARTLTAHGRSVRVIEKSRGVGGRMASRRVGDRRFDHGAQFFTTRSASFSALVDDAMAAGAVVEWTRGFGPDPDGYPRFRGADGMTSLCKWMAADAGIEVSLAERVTDLADCAARAHVITAPVPQALAILSFSGMLPEPALARRLAAISYEPTITVLAGLDRAPGAMADHGGCQFADDADFAFVTDNEAKGISSAPTLTVHLSNARSNEYWLRSDADVVAFAEAGVAPLLGGASFVQTRVQRWRYAGPIDVHPDATVVWGDEPVIALAGEAFAGPKVEGAYRSGVAAADAVHRRLG